MSVDVGRRKSGWYLAIAGTIGLFAALTLTVERFKLFTDPGYRPSCSINPILSCGSVMVTDQAAVLGFPNSILGICGFSVVATTGVLVAAGVELPRWYRLGLWLGSVIGAGFIHWLIFQSLYRIGALCPYCMIVWAVTIPTVTVVTRLVLDRPGRFVAALLEWRWTVTTVWFAVVALLVYLRFDDYWNTLI